MPDLALSQHRVIMNDGPAIIAACEVCGHEHIDNTGLRTQRRTINAEQLTVC
jgi:hypothetical protein